MSEERSEQFGDPVDRAQPVWYDDATIHALLNAPTDIILLVDLRGTMLAINENGAQTLGRRPQELIGTCIWNYFSPEVANCRRTRFDQVIQSGKVIRFEDERNGRWFDNVVYPVLGNDGRVTRVAVVARDITDRKQAEAALRISEERLGQAVRVAKLGFFDHDHRTDIIEGSPEYRRLLDLDPGPPITLPAIPDRIHPEDREWVAQAVRQAHDPAGSGLYSIEHRALHRDGSVHWVSARSQTFFEGEGPSRRPVRTVGTIQDITERKQIEEALRKSDERTLSLIDSIPHMVWAARPDGNSDYYNRRFLDYLEMNIEQMLGWTWTQTLHVDDRLRAVEAWRQAIQTGSEYCVEFRIRNGRTGEYRWFTSHGLPQRDGQGQIIRWYGTCTDITDRKRAEEQLRHYREHLEELVDQRTAEVRQLEGQKAQMEKLAATGRLAAGIAHEINNPLAGIKSAFLLVKNAVPADHPYFPYVGRIEKEVNRIAAIVRQMFELYRPDQAPVQEFFLADSLDDIGVLLRPLCQQYQVSLTIDTRRAAEKVALPEGLLRQVLYNLIVNAVEASPPGSTVTIGAAIDTGQLLVAVADQGPGIAENLRSRIFEPFFSTKGGAGHGMGLGLSVSRSLLESMKGELTFESIPGRGTTFTVRLPLAAI